jgi:alkylation response protein AidB-like acyl-CoA dehydrogenase
MDEVDVEVDPSWWQPYGMRASASYRVDFSGVTLDAGALIGQPGDYEREPWFTGGALRFAAVQTGGIEALCEITCRHLLERGRAGDPYQRARVGEMTLALHGARQWLAGAVQPLAVAGSQPQQLVHYARMCRSAIEQAGLNVLQLAQRCVGAQGFLRPHPLERVSRDLAMYLRQPGPDAVMAAIGDYTLAHYSEDDQPHAN